MNPIIKLKTAEFKCAKCNSTQHPIDRHHIRSQKMFVRKFEPYVGHTIKYKKFAARYRKFLKKDIALLCRNCHELIHEEYLFIILDHIPAQYGIAAMSWKQAEQLMDKFEKFFKKWVKQ